MSDPFRGPAFACPACGHGLREFGRRLVCDACSGMQITNGDLAEAITDLTTGYTELAFATPTGTGTPCPRCERQLVAGTMTVSSNIVVTVDVTRCERDGVWFEPGALVALFTQINKRLNPRGDAGAGHYYGGAGGGGGGGGAGSRIGLFRAQKAKRKPRPPYQSALSGRPLACPACREIDLRLEGERWDCRACSGAFVEDVVLVEMIGTMTGEPWTVPTLAGTPGDRACPVCAAPMIAGAIEGVDVERCNADGTWFDAGELGQLLASVSE